MNKVKLLDEDGNLFVICATTIYQYADDGYEYIEVENDDWEFRYYCSSKKASALIQQYYSCNDLDLTELGRACGDTEPEQAQQKINKQSLEDPLEAPDTSTIENPNISWFKIFGFIGFSLAAFIASYWTSIRIEIMHQAGYVAYTLELLRDLLIIVGISFAITSLWIIKNKYKQK